MAGVVAQSVQVAAARAPRGGRLAAAVTPSRAVVAPRTPVGPWAVSLPHKVEIPQSWVRPRVVALPMRAAAPSAHMLCALLSQWRHCSWSPLGSSSDAIVTSSGKATSGAGITGNAPLPGRYTRGAVCSSLATKHEPEGGQPKRHHHLEGRAPGMPAHGTTAAIGSGTDQRGTAGTVGAAW
jgi:hypothetical protein